MPEIVYLLTNPTMPDLVKIGRTTDLETRLRSLSTHSGVPVPFECFYACEVRDSLKVEKALHDAFGDHRINPKREFFRLNPDRAVAILELVAIGDATPTNEVAEDQVELDALHREQSRREQFRFSMVDIHPVGRQEYLEAKRTVREAECAKQSVWLLGGSVGSGVQADDIISLGTITSLCIQSGGTVEYQKWAKRGADEKAKAPANEPTDAASPED